MDRLPYALAALPDISQQIAGRRIALFLDLDGVFAPSEARPELIEVPRATSELLEALARVCPVTVVSRLGLEDLRDKVQVRSLYYAADQGFQILGPVRSRLELEVGGEYRSQLEQAAAALRRALRMVEGAVVEEKGLSLSVHYHLVPESRHATVLRAVADVTESFPALRVTEGRLVYELHPPSGWNRGKALVWIMEQLGLGRHCETSRDHAGATSPAEGFPIAIGDDLADEDMFAAIEGWGAGVIAGHHDWPTRATYRVTDHSETARLLEAILGLLTS